MVELADEHRRHAVERGAALGLDRVEHCLGLERLGGQHDARSVRGRGEVPHDHAEAVVVGDRHADAVVLGDRAALADEEAVVEDVVVAERRALRKAGRPARVLDVDRVRRVQRRRSLAYRLERDALGAGQQLVPRGVVEEDDALEARQVAAHLVDHRRVVARLERARRHEHPAPRLADRVRELVRAIGRVDVHEDHADLRRRVLHQRPLGAVRRPHAEPVAGLEAEREQSARGAVDLGVEL